MNSNINFHKLHLPYYKLPETEYINTVTHAQYFVPKILNTASAHFIQASHLMLGVIKTSLANISYFPLQSHDKATLNRHPFHGRVCGLRGAKKLVILVGKTN